MLFFLFIYFFLNANIDNRDLHSFPTRRSSDLSPNRACRRSEILRSPTPAWAAVVPLAWASVATSGVRSEEHTSELQSRGHLVCRLLLEKKKNTHQEEYDKKPRIYRVKTTTEYI